MSKVRADGRKRLGRSYWEAPTATVYSWPSETSFLGEIIATAGFNMVSA